ncbi:hypothetical protein BTDUT50_00135 [Neobacillus thermocopriae]|nr:hypothetical protein BTDUT50_00135 [Neobacillus thermocopriae]
MLRESEVKMSIWMYIDLFYLEDDQWEQFLRDYWSEIEAELQEREKQITPEVIYTCTLKP